jgi:hypothetical protein
LAQRDDAWLPLERGHAVARLEAADLGRLGYR